MAGYVFVAFRELGGDFTGYKEAVAANLTDGAECIFAGKPYGVYEMATTGKAEIPHKDRRERIREEPRVAVTEADSGRIHRRCAGSGGGPGAVCGHENWNGVLVRVDPRRGRRRAEHGLHQRLYCRVRGGLPLQAGRRLYQARDLGDQASVAVRLLRLHRELAAGRGRGEAVRNAGERDGPGARGGVGPDALRQAGPRVSRVQDGLVETVRDGVQRG
ncbi:unnamed protein product [Amoebophrya sp. A120]|nr:unnamed protein product [Amoebophrya sp. A120]|eukprot:GSA120T00001120001.1